MHYAYIADQILSIYYKCYYKFLISINPRKYKFPYKFTKDWFSIWIPIWEKELADLSGRESLNALEIGSFEGRASLWLLENILHHQTSKLTCLDIQFHDQSPIYKTFCDNLKLGNFTSKTTLLNGNSIDILPTLQNQRFDLIYIDGGHSEEFVSWDCHSCWRCLAAGGIMILDDYLLSPLAPPSTRPKRAIDHFLEKYKNSMIVLHKGYQIFIKKI